MQVRLAFLLLLVLSATIVTIAVLAEDPDWREGTRDAATIASREDREYDDPSTGRAPLFFGQRIEPEFFECPAQELVVKNGLTGKPMPNAIVHHFVLGPDSAPLDTDPRDDRDFLARIEERARRESPEARTETDGRVRIPGGQGVILVFARSGALRGSASLTSTLATLAETRKPDQPKPLLLWPEIDFEVRTLRPNGEILGDAPVSAALRFSKGESGWPGASTRALPLGHSDPRTGRLRVPDLSGFNVVTECHGLDWRKLHLRLALPGLSKSLWEFDLNDALRDGIDLRSAPLGSVRVRLPADGFAEALPESARFSLRDESDKNFHGYVVTERSENHELLFPHVGLGATLRLCAGDLERRFAGPTLPGEERILDLRDEGTLRIWIQFHGLDDRSLHELRCWLQDEHGISYAGRYDPWEYVAKFHHLPIEHKVTL